MWTLYLVDSTSFITKICTLSLHDALPISDGGRALAWRHRIRWRDRVHLCRPHHVPALAHLQEVLRPQADRDERSEEHTSELQSRRELVCCLLLEKKK